MSKGTGSKAQSINSPALPVRAIEAVGRPVVGFIEGLGEYILFIRQILFWTFKGPFRFKLLLNQLADIGYGALFIVVLTGLFTGLVIGLQSLVAFSRFSAESLVGPATLIALARELGPVFTGLMVSGRSGSGMATELGTMRVTEQIDALDSLAVNPIQYLVVPRMLASMTMMPVLVSIFTGMGFVGAYFIVVIRSGTDPGIFFEQSFQMTDPPDFYEGYIKSVIFGFLISTFSCFRGFFASGGAKGVGQAATDAVVFSSVAVFIASYFVTEVLQPLLHNNTFTALPGM